MDFLSKILGNGPVVSKIGKIEGGPAPVARRGEFVIPITMGYDGYRRHLYRKANGNPSWRRSTFNQTYLRDYWTVSQNSG